MSIKTALGGMVVAGVVALAAPEVCAQTVTAHGGPTIQSPHVVNIYWDDHWDSDHPAMTRAAVDGFTTWLMTSYYLQWLGQYNVNDFTFLSSQTPQNFLGAPMCGTNKPGSVVSSADILAFVECEAILLENDPTSGVGDLDPNLLFVVYLPASTNIHDPLGFSTCGTYGAYHFTGISLPSGLTFAYAVVAASCAGGTLGGLTAEAAHEIIEGVTDPVLLTGFLDTVSTPPTKVTIPWPSGWSRPGFLPSSLSLPNVVTILQRGEVADICESKNPVSVAGFSVPMYWSQSDHACVGNPPPMPPYTPPALLPTTAFVQQGGSASFRYVHGTGTTTGGLWTVSEGTMAGDVYHAPATVAARHDVTLTYTPPLECTPKVGCKAVNQSASAVITLLPPRPQVPVGPRR